MFDRVMHTSFFDADKGGYVLGYQHIFWFYSHPAVYIMMVPGFGITSESSRPSPGSRSSATADGPVADSGILVLAFSVWAHHMFVAGMADWLGDLDDDLDAADRGADRDQGVLLARDDLGGKIHLKTPMLFALGFIASS